MAKSILLGLALLGCSAGPLPECQTLMHVTETARESDCSEPFSLVWVNGSKEHNLTCTADVSWYEPETCDYQAHGFCEHGAEYTMSAWNRAAGESPTVRYTIRFRELGCRTSYEATTK